MNKLKVFSPFDRSEIGEVDLISREEVVKAIDRAHDLFQDRSRWLKKHERMTILEKAGQIMAGRVEELTKLAASEGGKPYEDSRVEVLRAINGIKVAVEEIGRIGGSEVPMGLNPGSEGRIAYTLKEPGGVVTAISAFNHPLNLIVHQVVPAIATCCPVVIKPADVTPLSAFNFVDILYEAGLPKDYAQCLLCKVEDAEPLVSDPRINFFTFIGSSRVGWMLRSKLAPGTRCALEHGGAAPVIVEPDANITDALGPLAKGAFYHAGQVCVSVQRIYAHEKVIKKVTEGMKSLAEKLIVGDPQDPKTEVGPLIRPAEVDRIDDWIKEAIDNGAELICGGEKISPTTYSPTVLLNPPDEVNVSSSEIFGPVVCIYSYSDFDQAIEKANALPFDFQAAIFTGNIDRALEGVHRLKANAVMVNDHTAFRVDWMPFGGRAESGLNMGGIPYSMNDMIREKLMVIKSGGIT
jgi:acyl-CoA reductase-like NAD-dependent aldehyde dehydrogenase